MSDKFIIRKGVPVPTSKGHTGITEMMSKLEVGDCIDMPLGTSRVTLYSTSKRLNIKITVRRQRDVSGDVSSDFLRMWRIQ